MSSCSRCREATGYSLQGYTVRLSWTPTIFRGGRGAREPLFGKRLSSFMARRTEKRAFSAIFAQSSGDTTQLACMTYMYVCVFVY